MKMSQFDVWIIAARPRGYSANKLFTDRVMDKISKSEILSSSIRSMDVTKKETFMMKLKHLPKVAILAIVVGAFVTLTGTAYAVVKTIESLNNVKIDEASTNDFGRQQLNATFTHCSDAKEGRATYELKRGSGLSAEDGAKTLQAKCDMAVIDDWFRTNVAPESSPPFLTVDKTDTVVAIDDGSIVLKAGGKKELTDETKIIAEGKEISKNDLRVGDIVYSYPDAVSHYFSDTSHLPLRLFRLTQPAKYYSADFQSYVNERGPCQNNPSRECLKASNINHTVLIVARGDAWSAGGVALNMKEVQGKVVSYTSNEIKLDVGKGLIYTVQVPSNVIDNYNSDDVYELVAFDAIYANTNPEDLKIKKDDSLGIMYVEDNDTISDTLSWSQVLTVQLMVERIPNNLDVLRKY